MKNPLVINRTSVTTGTILRLLIALAIAFALSTPATAQTPGGTTISNQASASYTDGTNTYNTVSNTVTVIVSKVAGLAITPDGASNPTVVAGQTAVLFNFTLTNTGNFTDKVHFVPGSAHLGGTASATITRTFIDLDSSGTINTGDTDITNATADSADVAQNGSIHVLVEVTVGAGATAGQSVQVLLGDASGSSPFDNQPITTPNTNEVRTVSTGFVGGQSEARGDISASVVNDALLQLTLTDAPAGSVDLGADITYTWTVTNNGLRPATGVTLNGSPQLYIIVPIPNRTVLKSGQTFPGGTLYANKLVSPLTTAPLSATWSTTPPSPLSDTSRIAFPIGGSLAGGGASTLPTNMIVTVNTGIDASVPIDEIGDVFGQNSLSQIITDQSGDNTSNNGDSNANFNETYAPAPGHGVIQQKSLKKVGAVLVGPSGAPSAVGPTDTNDDYSNKSVNTGIATIPPGGATNAPGTLIYVNTIQNTGNTSDTFTIDAPTVPAGFTVDVSTNGGASYTTVSGGGSVSLAIAFASSGNINVRILAPLGQTVLTGYDTVIRATSVATPASFNKTIDRLYTGFIRLDKASSVANATGVGAATDPVPGAVVTYTVTYTNVSTSNGDANCVKLTANNLVITEDGLAAPNNWGTYTTNSGSPSDSGSGTVATVSATKYTDTIASVAAAASGVFTFKRSIN
ncbi:MAG: hypothetical protein QOH71_4123 [Blastocatellia bacterium]|jgi:hypothetical protein|nr:hypothetical protein [Blastocatellia bacterium]